jgi:hypothetical protein
VPEVARSLGDEQRLLLEAGGLRAQPMQLEDARLRPTAHVEDAAGASRPYGEQRLDDVTDVDEVACLVPVAEDLALPAAAQPVEEDRDDAALERRPFRGA